jgi:hypothetical protein
MPRWFYKRDDGQAFGPLTERGMRELVTRGRLTMYSMVQCYEDHNPDLEHPWQRLSESGLGQRLEEEPAAEPTLVEVMQDLPSRPKRLSRNYVALCWGTGLWFLLETLHLFLRIPQKIQDSAAGVFMEGYSSETGLLAWMDSVGAMLLLVHLILVMIWHAMAIETNATAGAEVMLHTPGSVLQWTVPGLNLYYTRAAVKELWSLAKDPNAWSRRGIRTNLLLSWWWGLLVSTFIVALVQLIIRRNLGVALTDGRMNHWQGQLSLIVSLRDTLWAGHLILFIVLVWQLAKQQLATLQRPRQRRSSRAGK